MTNPCNLPEPAPKPAFQHLTGYTRKGEDVEFYVEQEVGQCYVSIASVDFGYIQFNFDPYEPQDAKQFYLGLLEIQSIEWEGRS